MSTPEPGQQPQPQQQQPPVPSGPERAAGENPYAVTPSATPPRDPSAGGWASGASTTFTLGESGARVTTRSYGASETWKIVAIVGFVFAFIFSIVGLIVSIIARRQAARAGTTSKLATAGIVVSIVRLVLDLVAIGIVVAVLVGVAQTCADLGPGTHVRDGVTYTCG
jgi:hypothetical protein